MGDRRTTVLDAAIEVLGTQGMRGLTHRAVDEAAELPTGSTSNLFRTRDALLEGVVDRFVERERAAFDSQVAADVPLTPEELGRTLARAVRDSTRKNRSVTLARYALLHESALRPELRAAIDKGGATVNAWSTQLLRGIGSKDPERDQAILANYLTGLTLHELANPAGRFDPTNRIIDLLTILTETP